MMIAINNLIKEPLSETLGTGVESYADRGAMFPYLQYVINIEPEWDYYKYMSRYISLPVVWIIPRAMWEDKPRSDSGMIFYRKLTGRDSNSITPTNVGWAYLEGGLFYVVSIFILLGLLFEFIDRSNQRRPIVLIFYILILHKAIKPEWDTYFMFASMIQMYIMYWVLIKFIGIKKRD